MPRQRPGRSAPKSLLLTAFRCIEGDVVTATGFGRTLNIGDGEVMLESPDAFPVGQVLDLEFLLDNNQIGGVRGHVTRIHRGGGLYQVMVKFDRLSAESRRLLARQVAR